MTKNQTNVKLSDATRQRLEALAGRYGTITTALEVAIDRMHREELGMSTGARVAAREALENLERWGAAAFVRYHDGTYGAIPAAHLTDASWGYQGCVTASTVIRDLADITGDERNWDALFEMERAWAAWQLAKSLD